MENFNENIIDISYYETRISKALFYITEYGKNSIPKIIQNKFIKATENDEILFSKDERNNFIKACHYGYYLGQYLVLKELLKLNDLRIIIKEKIKTANIQNQKKHKNNLSFTLKKIDFIEALYRNVIDTLFWIIFKYEGAYIRRLNINGESNLRINLRKSNIKSAINYIKSFRKKDLLSFVLITDLTSFVQIGDLIIIDFNKGIRIIELKAGEVNKKIYNFLDSFYITQCPHAIKTFREAEGDKVFEQLNRVIKQERKLKELTQIINKNEGVDIHSGHRIKIEDKTNVPLETYTNTVINLLKATNDKNYALDVVDDCLLIGVYKDKMELAFEMWKKSLSIHYPTISLVSSVYSIGISPIFLLPFPRKDVFDIITNRKKILLCLNYDMWFKLCSEKGVYLNWLSKKESAKEKIKNYKPFEMNNRLIKFKTSETEGLLSDLFASRIFYELITPLSVVELYK